MSQNFTSMDHNDIMDSLTLFMQAQDEFKDFNFDGSAIREFLRVLAYNTQQQAFQNNFVYNELQLDSAQLRPNLTSLASRLGYVPSSTRAATMNVNIVVTPSNVQTATASIVMDRNTAFYATNDGSAFTFSPDRDYTATLSGGVYTFNNVKLLQGVWALNAFPVQVNTGVESYIIPSTTIDTTTLEVVVRDSESSGVQNQYKKFETAYDLGEASALFFLRENRNGFFEFKFGDGKFSKKLNYGNVITIRYLQTEGEAGNNLSNVVAASSIAGYYNIQLTKLDQFSYGGSAEEDMESIRTLAPLGFVSSDNAVTAGDYVAIVKKVYSNTQDVIAWGGEDNDPPRFGYTYVSVKPKNSEILDNTQKIELINILKKYNVGTITPLIVDPVYTYINVNSVMKYDPRLLTTTTGSLRGKVIDACKEYSKNKLERFSGKLEMSRFSEYLNATDASIVGNFTRISYEKHFSPQLNAVGSYDIKFYHALQKGTISITGFRVSDALFNDSTVYRIVDTDGVLDLYKVVNGVSSVFQPGIGVVDYSTGAISISSFRPSVVMADYVTVVADPIEAYDIDSSITAFNNNVLEINNVNIDLTVGTA